MSLHEKCNTNFNLPSMFFSLEIQKTILYRLEMWTFFNSVFCTIGKIIFFIFPIVQIFKRVFWNFFFCTMSMSKTKLSNDVCCISLYLPSCSDLQSQTQNNGYCLCMIMEIQWLIRHYHVAFWCKVIVSGSYYWVTG